MFTTAIDLINRFLTGLGKSFLPSLYQGINIISNMKLENQVVSLEYAKKLKELGFEQESLWYWEQSLAGIHDGEIKDGGFALISKNKTQLIYNYSAYTVAELGGMLPARNGNIYIGTTKCSDNSGYNCSAGYIEETKESVNFCDKTEANARAKMLIYLKENKLV